MITGYSALFRLREIQNRPAEALALLTRLETNWPDINFYTRALRTLHHLRFGSKEPGIPLEVVDRHALFLPPHSGDLQTPGLGPFGAAEVYYLTFLAWVRIQISVGSPQAARPALEQALNMAATHHLTTRVIELSLLQAELEEKSAKETADNRPTWAALERPLELARAGGYIRIFDQGPNLIRLLDEAAHNGIHPDYIKKILTAIGPRKPSTTLQESDTNHPATSTPILENDPLRFIDPLSEREIEVLRLIAQGASNQVIADRLVITVGTVKSHINHILGKLDAHNRTEAVAHARDIGLLEI